MADMAAVELFKKWKWRPDRGQTAAIFRQSFESSLHANSVMRLGLSIKINFCVNSEFFFFVQRYQRAKGKPVCDVYDVNFTSEANVLRPWPKHSKSVPCEQKILLARLEQYQSSGSREEQRPILREISPSDRR
jgi:hypothetical protein